MLSDDSLKIRPHVSDSVNEGFSCGKLCCRNDAHGVFKRALKAGMLCTAWEIYDLDHACDLSNLTQPVSCCNRVIMKNALRRQGSKICLEVDRSESIAFTPITFPSSLISQLLVAYQSERADDSLESGL